jgi:hypothetical protein
MRMWMIPPRMLCKKHLLGEHFEIHKHRHNFVKKHNIAGRISPVVQIEPMAMSKRHDQLAKEMLRRKMNHKSDYIMPDISYLKSELRNAKVNIEISKQDLLSRCKNCKLK